MLGRTVSKNCLICIYKILFKFSAVLGFPCLVINCSHNKGTKDEIMVNHSKFHLFTSISAAILLTIGCVCCLNSILVQDKKYNILIMLTFITHVLFYLRAILCIKFSLLQTNCAKLILLGSNQLSNFYLSRETRVLIKQSEVDQIRSFTFISCWCIVLVLTIYGVHLTLAEYTVKLLFIQNFAMIIAFYVDFMITIAFVITAVIHRIVIKYYASNLKEVLLGDLQNHLVNSSKVKILQKDYKTTLSRYLSFVRRVYGGTIWNLKYFGNYCNPQAAIWTVIAIITLIFDIFIIVATKVYGIDSSFIPGFIELSLQLFITAGVILYVLISFEDLQSVNEDILSFLYKYPISRLSVAEAIQVEMLITTLYKQKPVLRPSDIFTIGTKLLAPISGTVVTYVLVAMQFRASWVED